MSVPGGRPAGLSLRLRLTLSYAGFLLLAAAAMFAVMLVVIRYVPDTSIVVSGTGSFAPSRSDLLNVAVPWAARGMLFLGVVGLVGGWFLAGRMLRPIAPIDAAVRLAATGSLSHRIDLPGSDDELRRLADGFDDMLGRLETAFEQQRRFTANASHELRTPLAINKAMLEVARSGPATPETAELLARLDEVNERAIGILEALLRLARADRAPLVMSPCGVDDVVRTAIARVEQRSDVRFVATLEPARVTADSVLLEQLVDNLLSNAAAHGAAGGNVLVATERGASGGARLRVENGGSELTPEVVASLVEPFVRAAGRTRGAAGSGLGLSVVAAIAEAHGAVLTLSPRPGGGLEAVVDFP